MIVWPAITRKSTKDVGAVLRVGVLERDITMDASFTFTQALGKAILVRVVHVCTAIRATKTVLEVHEVVPGHAKHATRTITLWTESHVACSIQVVAEIRGRRSP